VSTAARVAATEVLDGRVRRRRIALSAGALLLLTLWFVAPLALSRLDYFHVQTVQLEGARFLTPSAVVAALGADTTVSVFGDPGAFAARVEGMPLVARASVRRRLPGTLVVSIVERTPVALIATADGFRGVDSAGVRLPIDPAVSAFDAPVVLPASGPRDSAADRRIYNLLGMLRAKDPELFDAIEEVRRASPTEWHIRTTRELVRVRPEVTLERLGDIFPVEQDLARRHLRAVELDLRFRNHVIARLP
jgi:cell division protein FtsQ